MYYYPYYLHFINWFSFKYYNTPNAINIQSKTVDLWSITRTSHKTTNELVASYNYYTQNYDFCGKRYVSYDEVVNEALRI